MYLSLLSPLFKIHPYSWIPHSFTWHTLNFPSNPPGTAPWVSKGEQKKKSMHGFAVRLSELSPHSSRCTPRNVTLVALWAKSFNFFEFFLFAKRNNTYLVDLRWGVNKRKRSMLRVYYHSKNDFEKTFTFITTQASINWWMDKMQCTHNMEYSVIKI